MLNTKYDTAPPGALPDTPLAYDGNFWHRFSLFMQEIPETQHSNREKSNIQLSKLHCHDRK